MPYKSTKKTYARRGKGRRYASYGRSGKSKTWKKCYSRKVSMYKSPSILSMDKYYCKLTFEDSIHITPGVGTYSYLEYSMNSPYDPYFGVGGGTCEGYSSLINIWSRYIVYGCKAAFRATCLSNTENNNLYVALIATPSSMYSVYSPPTYDQIQEQKDRLRVVCKTMLPLNGTYEYRALMKKYYSIAKVETAQRNLDPTLYSGAYNGDPSAQPVLYVGGGTVEGAATSMSISGLLTITYYCKFYDRVPNLN